MRAYVTCAVIQYVTILTDIMLMLKNMRIIIYIYIYISVSESSILSYSSISLQFKFFSLFLPLGATLKAYVPSLGVQSEVQLLAYATATATPDPSHVCRPTPQLTAMPHP